MSTDQLSSKVFAFEKNMSQDTVQKQAKNIEAVIRELPSMKGIDDEYLPKFKYFQIKKSFVKTASDQK
jgi:hypothetical protein